MTDMLPVVGFRQDRSGARLIALLDMIRISQKFGIETRFLWLSQPDGPYPELVDPGAFFAPELLSKYIKIIDRVPELRDRKQLSSFVHLNSTKVFADALARGERFRGGGMIEVARFSDETPKQVSAELREIMMNLPLAPRLATALDRARAAVAHMGQGQAAAIHMRRGDLLDGDPWSYRAWPSKFVPDEFFREYVAMRDCPVIAFSDTVPAVRHMAQGDPRILPIDDLLSDADLTLAERDMLELLLMAERDEIAAPAASAFSFAASLIGGAPIVALPGGLPSDHRKIAFDKLLERVIKAPDSFYAPGDFAQSLVYAAQHAVSEGRAVELLDGLSISTKFQDRFPFVQYWLSVIAFSAGKRGLASRIASKAIENTHLRKTERQASQQIIELSRMAQAAGNNQEIAVTTDEEASFLSIAFNGGGGPAAPLLARKVLIQEGAASRALMFPPELAELLSEEVDGGTVLAIANGGGENDDKAKVLPDWTYQSDWGELMNSGAARDNLSRFPTVWQKIKIGGDLLTEIEAALNKGQTPSVPEGDGMLRIGYCAAMLALHGKLRRAFLLLHWMNKVQPNDPMTHKRLADCCYRAGNRKAADKWMESALALAPRNAVLCISAARRALENKDLERTQALLDQAEARWNGLGLIQLTAQELRRARKSSVS